VLITDPTALIDQLRDAALLYASRGWHVFPLIPGTKKPACPGHPASRCDRSDPWCRHGHSESSRLRCRSHAGCSCGLRAA
jgi:hypothetical protein